MNKAILIGNVTKDPTMRTTKSGVAACGFTLAVNRRYKDASGEKITDFIPVVAWRKTAELCGKYLEKGHKVGVVGEIQTRSYDKEGIRRYVTEVIADEVEFLTKRETGNEAVEALQLGGFSEIDDSDLPF